MKNKFIFLALVIVAAVAVMSYTVSIDSTALSPNEFYERISEGKVQLVDIRTPEEYSAERIDNALNIDFTNKFFLESFSKLNKELPVYIYCRSGVRTSQAVPEVEAAGFKEVYYLKGGLNAWKDAGFKTVNSGVSASQGMKKDNL